MPVGEMEIEGIAADDRDVVERKIVRNILVVEHLLAGPFIDTARTRTTSSELGRSIVRHDIVRPSDRDLGIVLFNYWGRF